MPKVMIAPAPLANLDGAFRDELIEAGFEMIFPHENRQIPDDQVIDQLADVPFCLAGSEAYPRRVLEALPELRVVSRCGVGYDAVDVEAATELGIAVTYAPGSNQEAVAEHTFLLMLAVARDLFMQDAGIRQGAWPRHLVGHLRGRTLGIVGLGRIGKAVATRAAAFGMKLLTTEPVPDHDFIAKHGVELVPLERLLDESHFVTLHTPLTSLTRGMINSDTLRLMRPEAILINTSRGPVVDDIALAEALRDKRIAGAGIDVFPIEPPGKDHPFKGLDNIVLTAHTAGVDRQSILDMGLFAARGIIALSRGEWPEDLVVNPEVKGRLKV